MMSGMARDTELADLEQRGDREAFARLYRRHTPALYALAMRLTGGSVADSEDLVQESWIRAVERLGQFERRSTFRTWISGFIVNCYREHVRRRGAHATSIDAPAARRALLALVERPERRSHADPLDVERAIHELPDGYREVIVLHDLSGYTHREIAGLLEIDESTSRSQLARGRARLRDALRGTRIDTRRQSKEDGHE